MRSRRLNRVRAGLVLSLTIAFTGCFHEEDTKEEELIPYPNLTYLSEFDSLTSSELAEFEDVDQAKAVFATMVHRLVRLLDSLNREIDFAPPGNYGVDENPVPYTQYVEIPTGDAIEEPQQNTGSQASTLSDTTPPESTPAITSSQKTTSGKVRPRNLNLERFSARGGACTGDLEGRTLEEFDNASALIWDDRNNDKERNDGDVWITFIKSCTSSATNNTVEGNIYYRGLADIGALSIVPYVVSIALDMQIEFQQGNAGVFIAKNLELSVVRDNSGDVVVSIAPASEEPALLMFKGIDAVYAFEPTQLFLRYADVADIESIEYSGKYYDGDLNGFVTTENAAFDFLYDPQDAIINSISVTLNASNAEISVTNAVNESQADENDEATPVASVYNIDYTEMDQVTVGVDELFGVPYANVNKEAARLQYFDVVNLD